MCTPSVAGGFQTPDSSSFFKDGRKIRVGDCAFFKPTQDCPPFIGIIRCLITSKESKLKFSVNWLYRPSEVETEKHIHLEAAPNEIFYSFHEDKVPAASLLHPCKVAFLPKGIELPSGIPSFICRRVYDTDQKCLWWLTDQNYIDKRQEEVDHLISKTREEMHATILSGDRFQKTLNNAAPALQVKADSDAAPVVFSITSLRKGKKRERSDAGSESVKRLLMADEGESYQLVLENNLKSEIDKITDRGGLVDYESVQKLVQMMPGKANKKIYLTRRSMLAGVVAATDKFDCLSWFVQLKGLSVFDDWLQEIHKGKARNGNGRKDGDKSVEDFLLVLLCALDKLPVNLRALQMCNIGKSVNHLRSHKNLEIQRKARSLVDTWKKRVEAEMTIDDGNPGSNVGVTWHGRHTLETSQSSGHRVSGSSENTVKSSSSRLSAPRTKTTRCDTQTTSSTSPEDSKSALSPDAVVTISNDAHHTTVAMSESAHHLITSVKDEKSSSSSQSVSQSSSSDHVKTAKSGKEDPRSSTAGSVGAERMLRRTSRQRRSISSLQGHTLHGSTKDGGSNCSPLPKHNRSEKLSKSVSIYEKMHDVPVADGNSHKFIVKIPNGACSPAVSAKGGSIKQRCSTDSRARSPTCPDKQEKLDIDDASQLKNTSVVTTKSWHSSDLKDVLTGSDEADGTTSANHDEVHSTNGDQATKIIELPKVASQLGWTTHEPSSFSPMNALVESCVKLCEANTLISAVDDVGINLLASVAATEMSKCDSGATNSPRNTGATMDPSAGNFGRSLIVDDCAQDNGKQDGNSSLVKNGREAISSKDVKPATDLSNLGSRKNRDDAQLPDMRAKSSNEISMKLVPDSEDGNLKETNVTDSEVLSTKVKHSECTMKENPRGATGHSPRKSNNAFENKANEVIDNELHVKKKVSVTEMPECLSNDAPHATPAAGIEKLTFDLNEFMADGAKCDDPKSISRVSYPAAMHMTTPLPFSTVSNCLPASVTVAAAVKGPFAPPEDLLRTGGELGWKGSAATSAFRPAEPRNFSEFQVHISAPSGDSCKSSRPFLNIDLNAPDESMQDEMTSHCCMSHSSPPARGFGGLNLDLNQIGEATEVGHLSSFSNCKMDIHVLPFKPGSLYSDESSGRRNFDLNDGPKLEIGAVAAMPDHSVWGNLPSQPPVVGLRMNNGEMRSFAPWFPQGSVIPAVLPDRGDQAFSFATTGASRRIYYTPPGSTSFAPDVYRGPVPSSSPALSFPSAPYQYPIFPFGPSFQVPSAILSSTNAVMDSLHGGMHYHSTGHSQFLGHPGVVSSIYPRSYPVSIPDGRFNGGQDNSNRWGSHGLDLNSGPRSIEVEGRNDALPSALRQFSVPSSQAFTEEQVRQASGVVMKRKESDGGWDAEKHKQQSWH